MGVCEACSILLIQYRYVLCSIGLAELRFAQEAILSYPVIYRWCRLIFNRKLHFYS
jgi:hypothetical protein